jgi:hypothetical protein
MMRRAGKRDQRAEQAARAARVPRAVLVPQDARAARADRAARPCLWRGGMAGRLAGPPAGTAWGDAA